MENMVMNEQDTPKQKLIHYIIGFGVAFYAALLVGAAWVPNCLISEWFDNFYTFVFGERQENFIKTYVLIPARCPCRGCDKRLLLYELQILRQIYCKRFPKQRI